MDNNAKKVRVSTARYWWSLAVLSARETWKDVLDNRPSAVLWSALAVLGKPAWTAFGDWSLQKPIPAMSTLLGDMIPGAVVLIVAFLATWLVRLFREPAALHTRQLQRIHALEATASDEDAGQVVLATLVELREEGFRLLRDRGMFGPRWEPWADRCEAFLEQNIGALEASRFRHSQSEPNHFSPEAQLRRRLESLDDVITRVQGKAITVIMQAPLSDAIAMRLMDREDEARLGWRAEKEHTDALKLVLHEGLERLRDATEQDVELRGIANHAFGLVDQVTENFDRMSALHDLAFEALHDVTRIIDPQPSLIEVAMGVGPIPPQERVVRAFKRIREYYRDRMAASTQRLLPPSNRDSEELPS